MKLASSRFIGSAKDRLLPISIPFRFFAAAAAFHLAAWALVLANADALADFAPGPGPILGAVHLLTLGVLVMTAMGASLQLLPVASMTPVGGAGVCRLLWWLYTPGVAVLSAGMAGGIWWLLMTGAGLALAGIAIYAVLLGRNLIQAQSLGIVVAHAWAALAALLALALLGGLLLADWQHGLLNDAPAMTGVHMVVAIYGFMSLLALGFSHILVPMFALAPTPPSGPAAIALALAVAAVIGASAALVGDLGWGLAAAGLAGLAAAGLYLWLMWRALGARMRKRLDPAFRLIRLGWVLLPVSILTGVAAGLGALGGRGAILFAVLALLGWLSSFLFGVLHRILPFLAAMHASTRAGPTPTVSQLAPPVAITLHGGCHAAAMLLLLLGIAFEATWIVRLAAAFGLLGALAFAWLYVAVVRRLVTARGEAPAVPEPISTAMPQPNPNQASPRP
ncbi:MAG: hypothetical protein QF893_10180 [Alphaproteobacteria bacterium]|jgi:hypothetical protein|nr:hypothetical protein [Alphaproteobacteria bacterium]